MGGRLSHDLPAPLKTTPFLGDSKPIVVAAGIIFGYGYYYSQPDNGKAVRGVHKLFGRRNYDPYPDTYNADYFTGPLIPDKRMNAMREEKEWYHLLKTAKENDPHFKYRLMHPSDPEFRQWQKVHDHIILVPPPSMLSFGDSGSDLLKWTTT